MQLGSHNEIEAFTWPSAVNAIKIVNKFSETIKYFRLDHVSIEMSDFLSILSSLPKAEHLELVNVFVKQPLQTKRRRLNGSRQDLQLQKLNTLVLSNFSEDSMFKRLPVGVLKELTLKNLKLQKDSLTGLIKRQSNIKKLILNEINDKGDVLTKVSVDIFDNLKLDSLELWQPVGYNKHHATILSKQTKLKSLILHRGTADDDVLEAISELTELETLCITPAHTPTFNNIVKLKKLKNLKLGNCSLNFIETFAELDNSQITNLKLYRPCNTVLDILRIPDNVVGKLARSVPNLKVFRSDFLNTLETFIVITQNFNFIEGLELEFVSDIGHFSLNISMSDCCVNPKLTDLKIIRQGRLEDIFLEKLLSPNIYPNLKKLEIHSHAHITTSQLKLILNSCTKIESLTLFPFQWKLPAGFLDCLRDHRNKPKSILLRNLISCDFTASELREKFSGIFDVIYFKGNDLYMRKNK